MCAHFSLFTDEEIQDLEDIIHEVERRLGQPMQTDIWPGYIAPVIVPTKEKGLQVEPMTWGYPGFKSKKPVQNTKFENAYSSPFWRDSFLERRCLIPATGFDEWQHYEDARPREFTFFASGALLYIAGIWMKQNREELPRFSMLTTEPNTAVKDVHDRMPLVLGTSRDASDIHEWLHGDYQSLGDCEHIHLEKRPAPPRGKNK